MENKHVTCLEIDLNAIEFNFNYLKSLLNESTHIMAVIKAFGYGTDAVRVAKILEPKVRYFAVAYFEEGKALRNAGVEAPILVLHPQIANLNYFSTFDLEPNIYSFQLLESWIQLMQKESIIQTPIHIKFNTGLNRLGFRADAVAQVAALVQSQQGLKIASVFSHIAASEDPNEKDFTLNQIQKFEGIAKQFITILGYTPLRHMLNTSGIINYASIAQYDMVRSGIGLYGFGNQKEVTANLKQVVTLRSIISQIHEVETGQSVGYNRASFAKQPSRIATIPIGHADGISRRFGNGTGYAYIKEEQVPYVGNVCMDMLMLDVTNVDCKEGDTVMIFKDQEHVEDMANRIETIPYELLTAISQRIKRKFK